MIAPTCLPGNAIRPSLLRSSPGRHNWLRAPSWVPFATVLSATVLSLLGCTQQSVVSVEIASIEVTPSTTSILQGESAQLEATVHAADGRRLSDASVTWASAEEGLVSVEPNGMIRGRSPGSTTVQATFRGVSGTATVRVLPGAQIVLARSLVRMYGEGSTAPSAEVVEVGNGGPVPVEGLSAEVQGSAGNWLGANLAETVAPTMLQLTVGSSLTPGIREATVVVDGDAADPVELNVVLAVAPIAVESTNGTTIVREREGGDVAEVSLLAAPRSDVVLSIQSMDEGEVVVSPSELVFTPSNWTLTQTLTLTGVRDGVVDGDQLTAVVVSVVDASSDSRFRHVPDQTLQVTTLDDDQTDDRDDMDDDDDIDDGVAGITIIESDGSTRVTERGSGNTDYFDVVLDTEPDDKVVLELKSEDTNEATVSPVELEFTEDNWHSPQRVTVTGVHDQVQDGTQRTKVKIQVDPSSVDGDDPYRKVKAEVEVIVTEPGG